MVKGHEKILPNPYCSNVMTNILVGVFAITLCLVNALVWTFISGMPVMGIAWLGAALGCFWLQKWSKF